MATEKALLSEDEFRRSCITLLCELEASLEGSRKALLALDLASLESGTREQAGLIMRFEPLRRQREEYRVFIEPANIKPANASARQAELRHCAHRVREATRLQAALLARAQAKLRVLGNRLAGPSATYEHRCEPRDEPPLRKGTGPRILDRMRAPGRCDL
jgi:hypothetical protein